jgi:putative addiction module CopG family antidote
MDISLTRHSTQFVARQVRTGRYANASSAVNDALRLLQQREELAQAGSLAILGSMDNADIMALAFIVMMEAAKSAREDLKAIMAQVKAINAAKAELRELIDKVQRDVAENAGQCDVKRPLRFSAGGLGNERAYHRVALPYPDPVAKGGVRRVPTNLHQGRISSIVLLQAIQEDLKGRLDSLSEMGEMESLRLQMAMDRLSKLMSMLSNLLAGLYPC